MAKRELGAIAIGRKAGRMIIANKTEMYKKLRAGAFGNTARSWSSYAELLASPYRGLLGLRSLAIGGPFLAYVPFADAPDGAYAYSEMQEDARILLQGEVYRSMQGLYLFASKLKTHMRPALRDGGKHYWRLAAYAELLTAMWPTCYDWLMALLDEYCDSVVEFSVYDKAVGTIPNRNTIIWEVRNY